MGLFKHKSVLRWIDSSLVLLQDIKSGLLPLNDFDRKLLGTKFPTLKDEFSQIQIVRKMLEKDDLSDLRHEIEILAEILDVTCDGEIKNKSNKQRLIKMQQQAQIIADKLREIEEILKSDV